MRARMTSGSRWAVTMHGSWVELMRVAGTIVWTGTSLHTHRLMGKVRVGVVHQSLTRVDWVRGHVGLTWTLNWWWWWTLRA